ncbi:hypothetical protein MGAS9429_Spy1072 [Streptococcus pyogenes MGAS9429]|uniref:Uncharacterized protein n=1 Tax=Streptococcus pyogenes serotype M12 (strain MGAS9429) TaxID=370551 RepID=Q1JLG0_STRPC|nr:hypothetical protein MGAS9429_Spy1072 [Streptococcus pyogenes MGAS9429]
MKRIISLRAHLKLFLLLLSIIKRGRSSWFVFPKYLFRQLFWIGSMISDSFDVF